LSALPFSHVWFMVYGLKQSTLHLNLDWPERNLEMKCESQLSKGVKGQANKTTITNFAAHKRTSIFSFSWNLKIRSMVDMCFNWEWYLENTTKIVLPSQTITVICSLIFLVAKVKNSFHMTSCFCR
jgi:hypothetical protein